jgi:hypothetical protein
MKTTQSSGTRPDHQTVAGTFQFRFNGKAIAIGFTDQRLSPHAGSAVFRGWPRPSCWVARLSSALPHRLPASNHRLLPVEKALAFMHGLLCDARKLTHAACLRRDPLVPELLGIERAASRKEGCTLDLDSTRLPPKDGHQEGVAGGYTRQGIKPCLHPLPAVLAGVRLAAQLWLRPGNTARGGNVTAFFLDLLNNLRGARADAGFCLPELPALWRCYKRAGRLRKRDQGIAGGFCPAGLVPGKIPGRGSGLEPGDPGLQPDGALPTASGLAAEGDHPLTPVPAVCEGGRCQPTCRQDHHQTGRART